MLDLQKAKLFTHGGSQAVRLPKAFRFEGSEVTIRREGDKVILEPAPSDWASLWAKIDGLAAAPFPDRPAQPSPREGELRGMKLSLDTDVAIEVIQGRKPHYRAWLEQAQLDGATLHLSSLVFHDLMFGAMVGDQAERQMERVAWFASEMEIHAWAADDAVEAARIRADLERSGFGLGGMDALIAGQAVNGGWTFVTGRIAEFIRVPNLDILSWADPSGPLDRARIQQWLLQAPKK